MIGFEGEGKGEIMVHKKEEKGKEVLFTIPYFAVKIRS